MRSVLGQSLRSRRRSLIGWSIGIAFMIAVTVAFYPTVRDSPGIAEMLDQLPEEVVALLGSAEFDLTSPAGYLDARLFGLFIPALLLVFAIGGAASTVAGEEERGELELLLALPLSRRRLVLEKAAAVAISIVLVGVLTLAALVLGDLAVGMDVGLRGYASVVTSMVLLAFVFASFALAVGCATGHRGRAVGVSTAVAAAAYLIDSLAPLASWLEPFQPLSPFYLYGEHAPLVNGLHPVHALALLLLSLALVAVAVVAFDRRDIGVGHGA